MKKRLMMLVTVLAMIMAVGMLAACSSDDDDDYVPAPTEAPAVDPDPDPVDPDDDEEVDHVADVDGQFAEHLTISMSLLYGDIAGRNDDGEWMPFVEYMMERFNFDFEIYAITWGDWMEVTRMWLASGTAPDILFQDVHYSRFGEFYVNATVNRFFRPYNLDNTPHMREMFNNATGASQYFMINDNLYAWPGFTDGVVRNPMLFPTGAVYRRDWAEAVGLANDNSFYTHDEWLELIRAVLDENPGNVDNLIGTGAHDDWNIPRYWSFGHLSPSAVRYVIGPDGDYVWGPTLPETLEVARLFNSLYQEGILWADQVLPQRENLHYMFRAGQAFSYNLQRIDYGNANWNLQGWGWFNSLFPEGTTGGEIWQAMDEYAEFIGFAIIEAPQGGLLINEPLDHWSHTIMTSSISDANADRWEQIMDWMVSDEGYFSRNMGRPDRHWEMGADGMPVATWDTDDDGNPIHPNDGFEHDWLLRRLAGNSDAFDFFYNPVAMHPLSREIAMRGLGAARGDYGHEIIWLPRDTALMFFTGDAFLGTGALMGDIEDAILAGIVESDIDAFWQDFIDSRWHLIEPVLNELNSELLGR